MPVPVAAPRQPTPIITLSSSVPSQAIADLPDGEGSASQGSGSRGVGNGSGSGNGEGDDSATPARQLQGDFKSSDFPKSARAARDLRIGVRFTVELTGRVGDCSVIRSSGYPDLDAVTCAVIAKRYRYDPARDGEGEPVASVVEEDEVWSREKDAD